MNGVRFRRADADDAAVLAAMEIECFSDPWSERSFASVLENPATLFIIAECEHDGSAVPVGYIGATVVADECDIINLAVMQDYRRQGIGFALAEKMIDICRKTSVCAVYLEHRQSNEAAAALYASLGFRNDGIRRRYYTSPVEDAVLMSLKLNTSEESQL